MFCSYCGNQFADGMQFCLFCGQPDTGAGMSAPAQPSYAPAGQPYYGTPVEQRANIRQSETAELKKMIQYFSQKKDQYDEYDRVCERLDPRKRRKKVGLLVWGILIAIVGLIVSIVGIAAESTGDFLVGLCILLGGAAMIVGFGVSSSARERNYQAACRRFDELTEELYQHYLNYGYCLVSAEYTNPSNLLAILQTIETGRADTIKEAVNILIEDAHRNRMELLARQTAISSAAAARGAQTAAVFSAANFFLK